MTTAKATSDKKISDGAPASGQAKNGTVKVPAELRKMATELGMEENPSSVGLFYKPHNNEKAEQVGAVYWDFRADEEGTPHPEGRILYHDGVDMTNDSWLLKKIPLAATIMRQRDKYLAEVAKKVKEASSELEDPVVGEVTVPVKKSVEQANAEAHEQYGKKTAEGYAKTVGGSNVVSGGTANSVPPGTQESDELGTRPSSIGQGLASGYTARQEQKSAGAQSAKNEPPAGSNLPAATASTQMVVVNKNAPTIIRVNGIEIPNDYILWYGVRQAGKIVNAKPYIIVKGLTYLASKIGLWEDPRAKDPNFPIEKLTPSIESVVIKNPWIENEWGPKGVAIAKGIVRMKGKDGEAVVYTDIGTATPENTNTQQQKFLLEQAIARCIGRALRVATACNICSVEEADLKVDGNKVLVRGLPNERGEVIDAEYSIVQSGGGQ